ncbi:DNA polymerase epsilon subunit 3 [Fistulifera solaris]|uniref:DNA polymerase epsilon subunit 3 n=1 Tax=Fistulifera solaris TaxID=1519565 RepID=A0A1Z5JPF1_FISSO|nr:DNA polymerase epsilon subunit 3 [Fistulifera solaris]|eukprot:GAX15915.1 DNA polymerase epsilon subunit 3 [Fistulifera solaris]
MTITDEAATPSKDDKKLHSAVEFEPPLACVRRLLKHSLPSSTNVGKDASAAFARACGIFIIYLTACANDFAREHKRQTITANDVLAAVQELDFDSFTPDMTSFLESYRQTEKKKKDEKAAAKKEKQEGREEDDDDDDDDDEEDDDEEEEEVIEEEEDEDEEHEMTPEFRKRKDSDVESRMVETPPSSPKKLKLSEEVEVEVSVEAESAAGED